MELANFFLIMQLQVLFSLVLIIPTRYEKQGGDLYSPIHTLSKEGNETWRSLGMGLGWDFTFWRKYFYYNILPFKCILYIGKSFRRPEQKTGYHFIDRTSFNACQSSMDRESCWHCMGVMFRLGWRRALHVNVWDFPARLLCAWQVYPNGQEFG